MIGTKDIYNNITHNSGPTLFFFRLVVVKIIKQNLRNAVSFRTCVPINKQWPSEHTRKIT